MRTMVRIKKNVYQEQAKEGDVGYIDGYVRGGNNTPLVVIIIKDFISLVPFYQLEVIKMPTEKEIELRFKTED